MFETRQSKYLRTLLLLIPCIVSISCSDEMATPPQGPMAGTWTGRIFRLAVDVTLVLSQNEGTNVNGTGMLVGSAITNGAVSFNVGGTCTYPDFSLDLFSQGFSSAQMHGVFVTPDSADATLDLSGFIGEVVPLKRN